MAANTKPAPRAGPVPRNRLALAIVAAVSAALLFAASSALTAPAARAAAPIFRGSSADGSIAFFETDQQLVPGDTDGQRDVYERSFDEDVGEAGAYVTREVSTGPTGGNDAYPAQFEAASADGSRVFFSTEESLVAADTDRRSDIYMHDLATGATTLVSQGSASCAPACGNGTFDAGIAGVDSGGDKLFFVTAEPLAAGDSDNAVDIYERDLSTETTTLVSVAAASCSGSCGNGSDPDNAVMWGLSADASTVFFTTPESLSTADTDSKIDIYARDLSEGTTTLVSQADSSCGGCSNEGELPVFRGSSADGSRAFFVTAERLTGGDSDGATDVYARELPGGPTMLVSAGGGADTPAAFAAIDESGEHAFFTTGESLVGGADTNGANDIYEWTEGGGSPSLITSGTCTQGAARNCGSFFNAAVGSSTVFFTTTESLVPADEDSGGGADIYAQEVGGGEPVWVSEGDGECQPECGNGGEPAIFDAVANGGSKVFFTTPEAMAATDGDTKSDIYVRDLSESSTSLSTATASGYCPVPAGEGGCPAEYGGVSEAGDHLFFSTPERLIPEDGDGTESDVYERAFDPGLEEEVTRLVSVGNSPELELGPAPPVLEATDPESPNVSTTPSILGLSEAGTSIKLYTEPNCTGAVATTGTAAELTGAGIPVSVGAGTTTFRATATDIHGDTSACSNPLPYTQESPAPPPPPPPPPGEEGGEEEGGGWGGSGGSGGSGGDVVGSGGGSAPAPSVASAPVPTHGGIAYVVPATRITFGPAFKTRKRRPVFRFGDSTGQPGTRFICRVDRRRWKGCASPVRLKGLRHGRHVFRVKAVNAVGVWEARPQRRIFKLVRGRGGHRNLRRHKRHTKRGRS
jgi:Tol biopolymer transport system component